MKTKKTLKDFKKTDYKLDLVHPELGETGAWVRIISTRSDAYLSKIMELDREESEIKKASFLENARLAAELAATLIVDWDEEFFECPFSYDKAVEILSTSDNFWIRDAINKAQEDQSVFFMKK